MTEVKKGYHPSLDSSEWFTKNIKPRMKDARHLIMADGSIVSIIRNIDNRGVDRITIIKHSPTGYILKVVSIPTIDASKFAETVKELAE